MNRLRRLSIAVATVVFVAPWTCGVARADWLADADGGFVHDSNVTRAGAADAIRSDGAWNAGGSLAYVGVPAIGATLSLEAFALGERYVRYRGLDHVEAGARVSYRHKLAMGAEVPYVVASVAASRDDYRDDLRDSDRFDAQVEIGRRFDATLDAALGAGFDGRNQRHEAALVPGIAGDVFTLRGTSAWLRATYAATAQLDVGARVDVRRGDVESTTHRGLAIFTASDAVAVDNAFGESDLYAYRLRGTTYTAELAASWALSSRAALTARYADERTRAAQDLDYRSRIAGVSLAYRW